MDPRVRTVAVWVFLLAAILGLGTLASVNDAVTISKTEAEFLSDLREERIDEVWWNEDQMRVTLFDGQVYSAPIVYEPNVWTEIASQGIRVETEEPSGFLGGSLLGNFVVIVAVLVVIVAALIWWGRRQQAKGIGGIGDFRKSKARLLLPNAEKTRFSDVGGAAEAKQALGDVVDWIKNPKRWEEAGVRAPRGVLLEGPPGNGKTLLARAVAGEAGVRFFIATATEFVELFVGVGAARVRDLFETAQKNQPCVIFIDELDAVGRRRGSGVGLNNDEREQTLNQLLVQLDGFERGGRFVVVAATNRADVLDPALLRPGRFDVRVRVGDPEQAEREEILRIHARSRPVAPALDFGSLARRTEGWTGAAIERLVNESSLRAMRRTASAGGGKPEIGMVDFDTTFAAERARLRHYDSLDSVLIESASQLAEPTGPARAVFTLLDGEVLTGRVLWANPELIKVDVDGGAAVRVLSRRQIRSVSAIDGTIRAAAESVPDGVEGAV